jgi:hypothetical protein
MAVCSGPRTFYSLFPGGFTVMKQSSLRQRLTVAFVVVSLILSALAVGLSGGPKTLAAVNWTGPSNGINAVNWA